ncbi:AraC family transcriptional regulator [Pseudonocardia sp. CA-107938]|uniref:helix-turn-helix transcriptional regulator n=1 Tax=Pseudonocardia sp. CA-107938 TaxID=3240021 RepID=UPI003D8B15CC
MSATTGPRPGGEWVNSGEVADLVGVPAADREARLEDLVSATHLDMAVRIDPGWSPAVFRASIRRRWVEDLVLVEVACDPCSGARGRRRAARTDGLHLGVMVVRDGRESVALDGVVAELRAGDVLVWRSDQPARFRVHEPQHKQTVIIPAIALTEVTGPKDLLGPAVLHGDAPATQLLTGYLDVLSRTLDQLAPAALSAARRATLDLAAAALQPGAPVSAPLVVMKAWIERRLPSGDVTPAAIAAAHGMSVRSVYRVFEETGETVSAFVQARRLVRARRDLATGRDAVSDIAARWGFADASHFSRAFRARYGRTPRDFRAEVAARR